MPKRSSKPDFAQNALRVESRLQWRLASQITFGVWKNWFQLLEHKEFTKAAYNAVI